MRKRTKKISEAVYQGIPFDRSEIIKRHVNMEEKLWYKDVPVEPPEFVRPKVEKRKIAWGLLLALKP